MDSRRNQLAFATAGDPSLRSGRKIFKVLVTAGRDRNAERGRKPKPKIHAMKRKVAGHRDYTGLASSVMPAGYFAFRSGDTKSP